MKLIVSFFSELLFLFLLICSFWSAGSAAPESCFQEVFAYNGHITSLNYPNPYPSGRNCTWIISTLSIYRLQLAFMAFDLEYHKSCKYDHVTIYDGSSTQDKVIGKFCGSSVPKPLVSSSNVLRINFYTDARFQGTGFNITFDSAMCGTNFLQSTGAFGSPKFPDNYPGNRKCLWTIEVPDNLQVSLNFENFQISNSSDLTEECITILDLAHHEKTSSKVVMSWIAGATSLADICNKEVMEQITDEFRSMSNKVFVLYESSRPVQSLRFKASFSSVPCGGVYKQDEGMIGASYPGNYGKDVDCTWSIMVSEGFQGVIHTMALEISSSVNCTTDYLEIRDGLNDSSPLVVDRLCDSEIPSSIRSSSNTMWIRFKSGPNSEAIGFSAKFTRDINECETGDHSCEHNCTNTFDGYNCSCQDGYALGEDGFSCLEEDECRNGKSTCSHTCINTVGSYRCSCREGYELDRNGKTCSDVDECQRRPCSYRCDNTMGSYKCFCWDGRPELDSTCRDSWRG